MIDLKPRKEFTITLENGEVISGKFGTWALKRFCMKKGYTLAQLGAALSTNLSVDDMVEFILCAVESAFRDLKNKESFPYSDLDACSWIDQMGGISSEEMTRLFNHAGDEQKKTDLAAA